MKDWGAWHEATPVLPTQENLEEIARSGGQTLEEGLAAVKYLMQDTIVKNNIYQVNIRDLSNDMIHLSIKRLDKNPVGIAHFRDFQQIKNDLVGPECEAVEIYPAETRLVDTSNQYHLWVFKSPTFRLPFGFNDRRMVIEDSTRTTKQRPLERKRR
jgi:hypothetical protein